MFDRAVAAIRLLRARGFRVNVNATLFDGVAPAEVAAFFDYVTDELDVEGITVSPGYAYERAPDQQHFLNRRKTKQLFRDIFRRGRGKRWRLSHSSLYLDFLAGNQEYRCTPWGNPTRNIFGWQRPCYLLGEGYASSFKELMETTDWDRYGTGNYEKCADCMAHCGYEATAVTDAIRHPLKALRSSLRADRDRRTDGARDPARAPAAGRVRVRAHRAARRSRPTRPASARPSPAARAATRRSGRRSRAALSRPRPSGAGRRCRPAAAAPEVRCRSAGSARPIRPCAPSAARWAAPDRRDRRSRGPP